VRFVLNHDDVVLIEVIPVGILEPREQFKIDRKLSFLLIEPSSPHEQAVLNVRVIG